MCLRLADHKIVEMRLCIGFRRLEGDRGKGDRAGGRAAGDGGGMDRLSASKQFQELSRSIPPGSKPQLFLGFI